jgi:hypothetical protein
MFVNSVLWITVVITIVSRKNKPMNNQFSNPVQTGQQATDSLRQVVYGTRTVFEQLQLKPDLFKASPDTPSVCTPHRAWRKRLISFKLFTLSTV